MAMTPRLEMRQGQALVMTPQLQQAIKLLQLSNVELQEFVEGELERNPLLEREESSSEAKKSEAATPNNSNSIAAWRPTKPRSMSALPISRRI